MNSHIMEKIAEKVLFQMDVEKLMNVEAAKKLDINPAYLSMIKKPDQYNKMPMKAWRKLHVWYHSGSSLRDYDYREQAAPETPAAPASPPTVPPAPPEFRHTKEDPVIIPATIHINKEIIKPEKPKTKRGPKVKVEGIPGSFDKGKPSADEIDRVLATLGIEIDIVVKLKK